MQHVYIVGSKGIPGNYGGYETFVDKLTEYHQGNPDIKYHVACKSDENGSFEYHNADCFRVRVPDIGPAQAIFFDVAALRHVVRHIRDNNIERPIVYILACRIGPFCAYFEQRIHKLGGELYVNPDGHEWMRAKWSAPVRRYWKWSESLMARHCDLLVCDSKNIERYIHEEYGDVPTTFIPYGAETRRSTLSDDDPTFVGWLEDHGLTSKGYYLVVGRFVPENNYETMIREFMSSNSRRDFALVTNVNEKFLIELEKRTHFRSDLRIKFVGTVYDQELLMKIREQAYGYFHGHEVGGTNPSLLEALGSTNLNLLLNVGFNREVAESSALYWTKVKGNLSALIDRADCMSDSEISRLGHAAKERIAHFYDWQSVAAKYQRLFLGHVGVMCR